ncbi:MAG: hypothetical protein ACFFG0_05950 [Candidatus Thorarchaeota archaeon]
MKEYKINEYLALRLNYPITEIYVNGEYFAQCKRLMLIIPDEKSERYNNIESIDDATEVYNYSIQDSQIINDKLDTKKRIYIDPEEEFWGHCSNLQAWVEHDYNTRLLKADLAFPLLEKLVKEGDKKALIKLKEEILRRVIDGNKQVIEYLFVENYLNYLNNEELLFGLLNFKEAEVLLKLQRNIGIMFKFVPSINRGLETNWNDRHLARKFSINSNKVTSLDLSHCDLKQLPYEIFGLKNIEILNIGGNPDIKLTIDFFNNILSNIIHLKIIVLNRNQIENCTGVRKKIIKERNLKLMTVHSGSFISLDRTTKN